MIDLVEAVKFFGGIAGLGTAAFTIYDRLLKSRPIISICAAEAYGMGEAYLRIKNRSDFDITLTAIETNSAASVLFHEDTRSIVQAALELEQHRVLAPDETAFLSIHLPYEFLQALKTSGDDLKFYVQWRRSAGPTWLQGRSLKASIRGADLYQMLDDACRRKVARPHDAA